MVVHKFAHCVFDEKCTAGEGEGHENKAEERIYSDQTLYNWSKMLKCCLMFMQHVTNAAHSIFRP